MLKNIIDQTSDPGYSVLRVLVDRYPELQKMAQKAEIDDAEFSKLAEDSFAWPEERRYPICDKEQTLLSLGYRKIAKNIPPEVDVLLQKAAEVYGIESDKIFVEPQEKTATVVEYWLLPEKKRYRVTNASEVKIAETVLLEKYAQLSVDDRAEAFFRLGEVAEKLNVSLSPSTYKLAGFTMTSTRKLRDWLEARKEACVGTELCKAYAKIAVAYENAPQYLRDRHTQTKLAAAIHALDQEAGLEKYYGKKLPDPIQTVFNTEKRAQDEVPLGEEFAVNKELLKTLPSSFWEDVLGEDITKEISPNGEMDVETLQQILPTLPADLVPVVQSQLAAYQN